MFINYAHRGASAYAPENTMTAFRLGIACGANGIETDIRRTRDGVPVLFHDAMLTRLTGIEKPVGALSYRELSALRIASPDGRLFDTIPTLAAFLAFLQEQPAVGARELKEDGLEADVLHALHARGIADKCVITSFCFAHLEKIKALDPAQQTGLLTDTVDDGTVRALKRIGAEQICPKAALLTPELVRSLHGEGFNVRAWGVRDEALMQKALRCGVDGMTVNFPDKLHAALCELPERGKADL